MALSRKDYIIEQYLAQYNNLYEDTKANGGSLADRIYKYGLIPDAVACKVLFCYVRLYVNV